MSIIDTLVSDFGKVKSRVTHFFTGTAAGQVIEKIGMDIYALPGFHDFWSAVKGDAPKIMAGIIQAATASPGAKSMDAVIAEGAATIRSQFADSLHPELSAGWEHALASFGVQEASALIPGVAPLLKLLAPTLGAQAK